MRLLIRPPGLRRGDTIAVISPSRPHWSTSGVEFLVEELESRGYQVALSPNFNARHGYVAGTPEQRGADLQWALGHPDAAMVWCLGGGHGAGQVHPHVDWAALRGARPRIVQGFSDITAIHLMVQRELGWVTYYGPNAIRFGDPAEGLTEATDAWCFRVLAEALQPVGAYPPAAGHRRVWRVAGSGAVEAPVVGGCLWLVNRALRTPWELDADGCILLLEDVSVEPYMVDGMLTQLRLAGALQGVRGIVFGEAHEVEPQAWNPDAHRQTLFLDDVLRGRLGDLGIPVLHGFPVGHGSDLLTVPLGCRARLDADARTFEVLEPGVAA